MSEKHLDQIFKNGFTVLESVIPTTTCDRIKGFLDDNFNEELPFNFFKGHYQINLPKSVNSGFIEEIVFDNQIHQIISEVFGKCNYYLYSYTCNANKAQTEQPFHMDCTHYHPMETIRKFGSPGPPLQLIVNTYLEDTNESNGSLEMVPGSHLFTDFEMDEDGRIDGKFIPSSVRCNFPKGSVIIRDKRTWHKGTVNHTNRVRYMVGTSYSINWYKLNELVFHSDCQPLFEEAKFSTWNIRYSEIVK